MQSAENATQTQLFCTAGAGDRGKKGKLIAIMKLCEGRGGWILYCVESFLGSGKDVTNSLYQGVSCLDFLLEQVEDKLQSYNVAEL